MADTELVIPDKPSWDKIVSAVKKLGNVTGALSNGPNGICLTPPSMGNGFVEDSLRWFIAQITEDGWEEQYYDDEEEAFVAHDEPLNQEAGEAIELNGNPAPVGTYVVMYELTGPVYVYSHNATAIVSIDGTAGGDGMYNGTVTKAPAEDVDDSMAIGVGTADTDIGPIVILNAAEAGETGHGLEDYLPMYAVAAYRHTNVDGTKVYAVSVPVPPKTTTIDVVTGVACVDGEIEVTTQTITVFDDEEDE